MCVEDGNVLAGADGKLDDGRLEVAVAFGQDCQIEARLDCDDSL